VVFSLKGISARISEFSLLGMLRIIFTFLISNITILPFFLGGVQLEEDQCAHLAELSLRGMLQLCRL
jgi:hypothetical protein